MPGKNKKCTPGEASTTVVKKQTIFWVFMVPVTLAILFLARGILNLFVASFFVAFAINPLVEFFQRRGASRSLAILTVYLILFLISMFVIQLILPRLIHDLTGVLRRLPEIVKQFQAVQDEFFRYLKSWRLPFDLRFIIAEFSNRGVAIMQSIITQISQGVVNLFSKSLLIILVPLVTYYISRDYPALKKTIFYWLNNNIGCHWTKTFLKIDQVCRLYIRGQLLDTLAVGVLLGIGLSIMGFEAAFLMGLIAGLFNLIPYFGPVLGALPVILFALLKSPWLVVYVILLFFLVNQLEVMVLAPRIIGGNLGLHPITIIFIILVGGKIGGLFGMIFAVPLGAIGIIIIKSIYQYCFLGDGT